MLVEGLQAYLAANSELQARLGTTSSRSDKTTGIFPGIAPDSVPLPYIVMSQITGEALSETYQGTGRLLAERWRFSCYGPSYKSAKDLAKALRRNLISLDGALAAGSAEVHGSWFRLEADDFESIPHGTLYATHLDFEINYHDNDNT
jgi:hypothetical protein